MNETPTLSQRLLTIAVAICLASGVLPQCLRASVPSCLPSSPPNIVIIFTDDLGYADVGAYGGTHVSTPNIDRMASEGVRFTDFYTAQPVCSAARAALLTGCYPNRVGITGALGPKSKNGIRASDTTLAEVCKTREYATAVFGKWHLGSRPEYLPTRHGFDEYYGIPYSNDMWPNHPESPDAWGDLPTIEQEEVVGLNTDQARFTTDFTERAVSFIERHADEPFFLYVAHPMPHVPLHVSDRFRGKMGGLFEEVIAEIDWSVGRILETLEARGLDERTLVIFTSDNGPWLSYGNHAGSAGPLREGKGTTFEGGVRMPCVMRWPGRIPPGSVCREPAMTIDVLPTVAKLIEAKPPESPIDGRDIWSLISGEPGARSPQEAYFFYYHRNNLEAIRSGRWKLHFPHTYRSMAGRELGADGIPGKYNYGVRQEFALYDLTADIGESTDVSDEHPEVVARLTALADRMRADLGDALTD